MNGLWLVLVGWWLAVLHFLVALLLTVTIVGFSYAQATARIGLYVLWPFGSHVVSHQPGETVEGEGGPEVEERDEEKDTLLPRQSEAPQQVEEDPWSPGYVIFLLLAGPLLFLPYLAVSALGWTSVVFLHAGQAHLHLLLLVTKAPRSLVVHAGRPRRDWGERCVNVPWAYTSGCWSATVLQINICFVNLSLLIPFAIGYGYRDQDKDYRTAFACGLLSIVPLTHFIFHGISGIARHAEVQFQSIFVGAVMNGIFGGFVELMLYVQFTGSGGSQMAHDAIIGQLLGLMLLLPATAMCIGGFRYSEQLFNFKLAGISSVLLVVSVLGAMTPTMFYECYSKLEMFCDKCEYVPGAKDLSIGCHSCHYKSKNLAKERLYIVYTFPLELICALVLPLAYFTGIGYSLNAHEVHQKASSTPRGEEGDEEGGTSGRLATPAPSSETAGVGAADEHVEPNPLLAEDEQHEDAGGEGDRVDRRDTVEIERDEALKTHISHLPRAAGSSGGAPEQSSSLIFTGSMLFVSCVLTSFVTDVIVRTSGRALIDGNVRPRTFGFVALGLLPLVPYFSSAIDFAWHDKIAISIELASSACVHICLIQIPFLVLINWGRGVSEFNIIFPSIYVFATIFSVVVLNYVSLSGRVNYFEGVALLCVYLVWLSAIICMPTAQS